MPPMPSKTSELQLELPPNSKRIENGNDYELRNGSSGPYIAIHKGDVLGWHADSYPGDLITLSYGIWLWDVEVERLERALVKCREIAHKIHSGKNPHGEKYVKAIKAYSKIFGLLQDARAQRAAWKARARLQTN